MKRLSLVSIAIAAAFAIPQLAQAQTQPFDFTGPTTPVPYGTFGAGGTITIAGTFDVSVTPLGGDGGYEITDITGTYSDTVDGVSGAISMVPGWGTNGAYLTSTDGSWNYDNLYYPAANAPNTTNGEFDLQGLLFYVGPVGDPHEWEVNFWAVSGTTYQLEESITGQGQHYLGGTTNIGITPANTQHESGGGIDSIVPEGGGLPMLGLCGLLLGGAFLFKAGKSSVRANS